MIFSPQLVRLLAPGFAQVPGKFELAVLLTRMMFPFLVLVALAAQAMGVLNACDRFGVPALASTFFNIGSVAVGLALGFTIGRPSVQGPIVCMACGVVAGGALQLLWQVPSAAARGLPLPAALESAPSRPAPDLAPDAAGPAGQRRRADQRHGEHQLRVQHHRRAGHVINGPVSWLGYAFRFMQLPLGLFGVAIASATLPAISRSAAAERMDEFRETLARSLGMVLLLTIPSSVGLAVLGREHDRRGLPVGPLHAPSIRTRRRWRWPATASGLAGYAAIKILAPAFYALNDARTPMLVSVASIAVNLAARVRCW